MKRNEYVGQQVEQYVKEGKGFQEAIILAEKDWLGSEYRTTRASGTVGTRDELYELLREGPVDDERFKIWLADGSDNIRRHEKQWKGIVDLVNAVWEEKASAKKAKAA